jgi:hypothetical protein
MLETDIVRQWVLDTVREDYAIHRGWTFTAQRLIAYDLRYLDTSLVELETPAVVKVVGTEPDTVQRVVRPGIVDPLWAVELVRPHAELPDAEHLLFWIEGPSYDLRTGEQLER